MFSFIFSILGITYSITPQEVSFHSSASYSGRIITNQSPREIIFPKEKIKPTTPWSGHFSAVKFKNNITDRIRLVHLKKNIRTALFNLPTEHSDSLLDLEVKNEYNRSRGLSNDKKIILNIKSIDTEDELNSVFVHEMGHIVDLGLLKGTNNIPSGFKDGKTIIYTDDLSLKFYRISWDKEKTKRRTQLRSDFISGYATYNCFEDFAESYLFYQFHGEKFRELSINSKSIEKKYNFFKNNIFDEKEFQLEKTTTNYTNNIFDATLLPL